jgi:hypothetical protein
MIHDLTTEYMKNVHIFCDLTNWTSCINYQMINYKHESEVHFQSKYLYLLNQLVWRLPIPGTITMIKNKINNSTILMDGRLLNLVPSGQCKIHNFFE